MLLPVSDQVSPGGLWAVPTGSWGLPVALRGAGAPEGQQRCWAVPGHVPVPHPAVVRIPSLGRAPQLSSAWTLHPLLSFLAPRGGAQGCQCPLTLGKELLYSWAWDPQVIQGSGQGSASPCVLSGVEHLLRFPSALQVYWVLLCCLSVTFPAQPHPPCPIPATPHSQCRSRSQVCGVGAA